MKKILILASWRMSHVRRFVENLGKVKGDELKIGYLDNSYGIERVDVNAIDYLYTLNGSFFQNVILKIPRVRIEYVSRKVCRLLDKILTNEDYDLVNMQVVHTYAPEVVKICKKHKVKVLLSPFGSEVLRIGESAKQKLKYAFLNADYVATKENSSFSEYLISTFGVNENQFVSHGAGSETISAIMKNKGKMTREEMSAEVGLPCSPYNICCGYNAQKAQRHSEMLDAIAANKKYLPDEYQIIIPLSYGEAKAELLNKLKKQSELLGLNVAFITNYLSVDQLSYFRMVTDLFIHVQTTDAANASLQEFILAGARCINGKWLSYPYLEEDGYPYYICPSMDELPSIIKEALLNRNSEFHIPSSTIAEIESNAYCKVIINWKKFFVSL